MKRSHADELLLGEWACLGILALKPTHGFAIASRLTPKGDVGRVWAMSRALTYRALDQLAARELIREVGEEPGIAGGNRTILAPTRRGRAALRAWLAAPTQHLRDLRSELLLKLVLSELAGIDQRPLLLTQRDLVGRMADALEQQLDRTQPGGDVVTMWRSESANGALRFLDRLLADPA
ncbi:MAG: transcriptional regulator, PadR-like family [Ilumatobacteraceae bacterium]|nr:transcriptional regulator, PadR-like family [Ilumatobacteraceae bacterium]